MHRLTRVRILVVALGLLAGMGPSLPAAEVEEVRPPDASAGETSGAEGEAGDAVAMAVGKSAEKPAEKGRTFPFIPIASYTEETSALLGIMLVKPHRWKNAADDVRPNTIALTGYYTLRGLWGFGCAPSIYFQGEEYLVEPIAYLHRSPATFWGVGHEAGEEGESEDFTAAGYGGWLRTTKTVYKSLRVGPSIRIARATISSTESGGLLDQGAVEGSDGGTISGAGLVVEWDDRDSVYWPTTGGRYWAAAEWYRDLFGSDFHYDAYYLDLRRFISFGDAHVIGVHSKIKHTEGDPPFYALSWVGGHSVLRGLYEGRFRDKTMAALEAEYRVRIWRRWGAAVFAGVGEVAESFSDFSTDKLLLTGGVGLRFVLDPKEQINLRIDVGVSEYGIAPTLVITEAF